MRWKWLAAVVLALCATPATAQTCMGFEGRQIVPFAYEAITVSSTALGFTAATLNSDSGRAIVAEVGLETANIRVRVDGGVPTNAVGKLITAGANVGLTVCGTDAIRAFRAIRVTGDATITVTYYRDVQ